MKILIYSVNIGSYEQCNIQHVRDDLENDVAICYRTYTDKDDTAKIIGKFARSNLERSRRFRMNSHAISDIQEYDFAVYLDANVQIQDPRFLTKILESHELYQWDLLMSKHNQRQCPLDERMECVKHHAKYSKESLDFQLHVLETRSFDASLAWCGFNVQWIKSPRYNTILKTAFLDWWHLILQHPHPSLNDQIVWPVILHDAKKNGLKYYEWEIEYMANKSFQVIFHSRKLEE